MSLLVKYSVINYISSLGFTFYICFICLSKRNFKHKYWSLEVNLDTQGRNVKIGANVKGN